MPDRNEQERLLIHDTVATTVDTIVAAIQAEIGKAEEALDESTRTIADRARREGFLDGLSKAAGTAAIASVAARAAAMHGQRPERAAV